MNKKILLFKAWHKAPVNVLQPSEMKLVCILWISVCLGYYLSSSQLNTISQTLLDNDATVKDELVVISRDTSGLPIDLTVCLDDMTVQRLPYYEGFKTFMLTFSNDHVKFIESVDQEDPSALHRLQSHLLHVAWLHQDVELFRWIFAQQLNLTPSLCRLWLRAGLTVKSDSDGCHLALLGLLKGYLGPENFKQLLAQPITLSNMVPLEYVLEGGEHLEAKFKLFAFCVISGASPLQACGSYYNFGLNPLKMVLKAYRTKGNHAYFQMFSMCLPFLPTGYNLARLVGETFGGLLDDQDQIRLGHVRSALDRYREDQERILLLLTLKHSLLNKYLKK